MVGHDLMDASSDTPGVIAPPPVIYAAAVAAGLVLDLLFPVYVLATLLYGADRVIIGIAVIIGGVALAVSAFPRSGLSAPIRSLGSRRSRCVTTRCFATCATRCTSA